ncbi:MAG: 5'-methylthioadenosine/S-adenosylhomocysteine nucleosidase [Ruminococcaceae bacterium]|nr:5'-methylthioadenosine/S-adenosylhomocysteine nucleosidase [Oscillospiraceae bacterium]
MNMLKIGIIVADIDEYKSLKEFIESREFSAYDFLGRTAHKFTIKTDRSSAEVISILCGIGKVNAAAAAMHLCDIGCNVILNYGLSGGISNVHKGELCLCDAFLEHDFDLTGIGYKLCEKPLQKYIYKANNELLQLFCEKVLEINKGTAVSGDRFICDAAVRNSLRDNFGAMSCDMETAAIAYVCDFADVPFLSLRKISDDAGESAIDSYREMNLYAQAELSSFILKLIEVMINCSYEGKKYE